MLFIGHDLGTSGDKAVLVDSGGEVLASASASYALSRPREGWAEQDPKAWWAAVATTTRALLENSGVPAEKVTAMGFAGQMLALVPMDARGEPTRPALSWLDARATEEATRLTRRFGGERVVMALAGGKPTAKDLLPKMAWIRRQEPQVWTRTTSFGDATSYLVARATGVVGLDPTAAGATGVFDPKRRRWSRWLAKLAGAPLHKMPPLRECAEVVGTLTSTAAGELHLTRETRVIMGMSDIPAAAVGAGASTAGRTHVYLGTSGWVGRVLSEPRHNARRGISAVPGVLPGTNLVIGEMETAGACRERARRWLDVSEQGLDALADQAPPGAGGVRFLPHLFGERAPYPDATLRGAFLGLDLGCDRAELARAVLEGVALNLREILEETPGTDDGAPLPVVGGGARSDTWLAILADVLGREVLRVPQPELAGAKGVARLAAVGVGALPSLADQNTMTPCVQTFRPRPDRERLYADALADMKRLRPALAALRKRNEEAHG